MQGKPSSVDTTSTSDKNARADGFVATKSLSLLCEIPQEITISHTDWLESRRIKDGQMT